MRTRAIEMLGEGKPMSVVARELDTDRETVRRWRDAARNCSRCEAKLMRPAILCGFCIAADAERTLADPGTPQHKRALALCDLEDLGFPAETRREIAGPA